MKKSEHKKDPSSQTSTGEFVVFHAGSDRSRKLTRVNKKTIAVVAAGLLLVVVGAVLLSRPSQYERLSDQLRSDTGRASLVSEHFAREDPAAVVVMYDQLLRIDSDKERRADYYSERAVALSVDYFDDYKDLILSDAKQADRLNPTAASARLVESIAADMGDKQTEQQYQELYAERVDPNERPE